MPGLDDRSDFSARPGHDYGSILTWKYYTVMDTTLPGYRVPKDTVLLVNLMNVHLDPKCWEN